MKLYTDSSLKELCFVVLYKQDKQICRKPHKKIITVNEGEYTALIEALISIPARYEPERLDVYSDSQLMVRQIMGDYKCKSKKLNPLKQQVWILARALQESGFLPVTFNWVPREDNLAGLVLENKEMFK
jgi:ribonuclease HI